MHTCATLQELTDCRNARCGTFQTGLVYGLYDARVGDIFYVGSTVQRPGTRYSAHMHASSLYSFREAWIMAIVTDGSLPLFFPLCELATECEHELKEAERTIARALQAMGHTALCDGGTLILHRRIPLLNEADRGSEARWNVIKNAIAEHLDRVNEQARVVRWLREMWLFSADW